VAKEFDRGLIEGAFLQVDIEVCFSQLVHDLPEVDSVLFRALTVYQNVVQENDDRSINQGAQYRVH
jgi:hypothetical protein